MHRQRIVGSRTHREPASDTLRRIQVGRRGIQLEDDGEKILGDSYSFRNTCKPTAASVKKMKVFGEKISNRPLPAPR